MELKDGVYLFGTYLGWQFVTTQKGQGVVIGVASGLDSQRVFMEGDGGGELQAHKSGEKVIVTARPYAGKNGLGWSNGSVVGWPDDKKAS